MSSYRGTTSRDVWPRLGWVVICGLDFRFRDKEDLQGRDLLERLAHNRFFRSFLHGQPACSCLPGRLWVFVRDHIHNGESRRSCDHYPSLRFLLVLQGVEPKGAT